jgi:uncharacterized LabA/DUF88 family protein
MKACVFVDGENFRYAIGDLFESIFNRQDYLPKNARWAEFFDWIVSQASKGTAQRLRTYWYVIDMIDFYPYKLPQAHVNPQLLQLVLEKDSYWKNRFAGKAGQELDENLKSAREQLEARKHNLLKQFNGYKEIQCGITSHHDSIEFRRAGAITYNLFKQKFGKEKAVDVNLAIDMFRLKDIYDYAVIVSGDQDYVPAVKAIKDQGKRVINIAFRKSNGELLPGGARRLSEITDSSFLIDYDQLKNYLNI